MIDAMLGAMSGDTLAAWAAIVMGVLGIIFGGAALLMPKKSERESQRDQESS